MAQPQSERTCLSCGTVFMGSDIAKTCSVRCRKRLQRAKSKLEKEAELAKKSVEGLAHKIEVRLEPSFATEGGYIAGSLKPTPRDQAPDDTSNTEAPASFPAHSSYPSADPKTVPPITTPSPDSSSNSSVTTKKTITPAASEADSFVSPTNFLEKVQKEGLPPAEGTTSSQTTIINHHHYPSAGLPAWMKTAGVVVFVLSVLGLVFFLSNRDRQTPLSQQNQTQALQQLAKSLQNSPIASAQNLGILNFNADTVVNNGKKLTATGQVALQNQTDSTRALAVQNATGQDLLIADTTNQKVGVGSAPNVADASVLQVAGDVSSTGLRIGGNLVCTANGCTSSTPIPAAVDTSNLAKLNGNQTFTGANSFNNLTVNGNLGISGAYSSGGSTGVTSSCGSGFALTNPVFAGGLTVGGVCTSISGATTPTMQQTYNTSTTPEITVNSTNGALTIQDASTPLGANLFEVQSNGGPTKYFAVTSSGVSVTGNVNITGQYQVSGTQIASSNLQDAASLAKLAANQTFSGNNTFSNNITAPGLTTSGLSLNIGNTAAALNLQGNLSTNLSAISGANTIKVGFSGTPVGNVNYNFDNTAAAGTYTVCTTTGNCAGVGGSVTTSGGTANAIAKFTSSNGIASSNITDNGTTVTVKPTANSTSSFQVQNAAGTSNLLIADTTNTRIAIGQATATYPLDVAGDINSTTGIRVGGTLVCTSSGCTATAGSGSYIQNGAATQTANFNIRSAAATSVGAVVEGASGQTADILDVQSFGGTTKYLAVTTGGIAVAGNVNTTGQYQVGGAQISSANLSNDSNLAKLGSTQTFSGNNTFSGTVLSKNSANSTAAFQVQNAAGNQVLAVDTTNGLVALGLSGGTGVQGQLVFYDTASLWKTTITSSTGHTGNYTLQLPALSAGTYDLCTSSGNCPGVASTLQQAYDASASPATITTSSAAKGIVFKAGTGFDSTNLFQIQNAAGSQAVNVSTVTTPNLVSNGDFESTTNGWSGKGSATIARNDASPSGYSGTGDLKITTTALASDGAYFNYTLAASTQYTLSLYAYSASSISTINIGRQDVSGTDIDCLTAQTVSSTWTRYSCTFTTGATITPPTQIYIKQSDAIAKSFYIDSVQLEQAATASVFQANQANVQVSTATNIITLDGSSSGALGPWSTNPNNMPASRQLASSATANGYVYAIGGYSASGAGPNNTVYYAKLNADGSTGSWATNANALPAARAAAASVIANGYVYVLGGDSGAFQSTATSTVYYAKLNADGSTGAWQTNANPLPAIREEHGSIVANGYIYVIGGFNNLATQSTVYYAKLNADGSTGAWSTNVSALPAASLGISPVVANGYVYVMGSNSATVYYAKLNADGSTGAWQTNANSLPAARMYQTSVVSNGYIYVVGGNGTGAGCAAASQCTTVYYAKLNADGSAGSWNTNTNPIPTGVEMQSSVVANGYIYSVGGCAANTGVGSCFNNGSAAVYYASASRIQIGANLDLVGLQGGTLSDPGDQSLGSNGGSIAAANGLFTGAFQVQGNASFAQGLSANGNLTIGGSALFQNSANSTVAFQVQNAGGNNYIQVDTSGAKLYLGNTGIASTIQIGNSTGAVAQTINIGNNATVSSSTTIIIGSTIGASAVTIQSGTGDITLAGHLKTNGGSITSSLPINCGTGAGRVQSGTDTAGTFGINAGTGTPGNCSITISFSTAYNTAPSAVLLTPITATSASLQAYVSSVTTTGFTVVLGVAPAASQGANYYYLVIE